MSRYHKESGWQDRSGQEHRARAIRLLGAQCSQCGRDADADGVQLILDHVVPLADGGEPFNLDNEQVLCGRCHREKTRAEARARWVRQGPPERPATPSAPGPAGPGGHFVPAPGDLAPLAREPMRDRTGMVLPRYETSPHPSLAGSYGGEAAGAAQDLYGRPQRAWQKYALRRGLEHDDDGRLLWRVVIVTVARQQGKSDLMRALAGWRMTCRAWPTPQVCVHTANRVQTAREIWVPLMQLAKARGWRISKGRGEEEIATDRDDRYLIRAAGDALGIGYTVDLALVDEAWDVDRDPVENGLMPAQSAVTDPQLWLFSTAGESTSDLLRTYRDAAIAELAAPGETLILEWSAPEAADPGDPLTWEWASPHWNPERQRSIERDRTKMRPALFRANYCNQWVQSVDGFVDPAVWEARRDDPSTAAVLAAGPWHVAAECAPDGTAHTLAAARKAADGPVAVRVWQLPSYAAVDAQLAEWRAARAISRLLVTPPYEHRLPSQAGRLDLVGRAEVPAATRTLAEMLATGVLIHDGDPTLTAHMLRGRAIRTENGPMLSTVRSAGTIHAARAAMFAIHSAVGAPAEQGQRRRAARYRAPDQDTLTG